ncbi:MAG: hypothetical protein K0S63_229 [Gammaproteobacteria bacterium]|nr:hypothetical protein [Gammaproteobacteria bacterium]
MPTKNRPKRHHVLSQCYLKKFSKEGKKDSQLVVIDKTKKEFFSTSPDNIAVQKYFNRLETGGTDIDPDFLETKILSDLETKFAQAVKDVEATGKFEGENRRIILTMMAFFALRNPEQRERANHFYESVAKLMISCIASNPIGTRINGIEITQTIKNLATKKNDYKITVSQNMQIDRELKMVEHLFPLLNARKWMLVRASENIDFITSDHPVILAWKGEQIPRPPGHKLKETFVYFPLTRKLALIGDFDGEDISSDATDGLVAAINGITLQFTQRQIYSSKFQALPDQIPS